MNSLSTWELFALLRKQDPRRAETIDPKNPRRLVRALEIVAATGTSIPPRSTEQRSYDALFIGLRPDATALQEKIHHRLRARLRHGMIAEVRRLHRAGVSWKRLDNFGLEYRFVSRYLRGIIGKDDMVNILEQAIRRYAKRQFTWFRRNRRIHWVASNGAADRLAKNFLSKKRRPGKEDAE